MITPEQRQWLQQLLGRSASPGDSRGPAGSGAAGDAGQAVLDRPGSDGRETPGPGSLVAETHDRASRTQANVTIVNSTGADLRLTDAKLQFKDTARFVPAPTPLIPAWEETSWDVVETTQGAPKTAGSVVYVVERAMSKGTFSLSWAGAKADYKIEGPYSASSRGESDSEKGNTYLFYCKFSSGDDEALQVSLRITNASGFGMALVSATVDDPQHTEFAWKPKLRIEHKSHSTVFVQASDEQHKDAAGTIVYRVERPDKPYLARMSWKRDGRPLGRMEPNDGAFMVEAEGGGDRFEFRVVPHAGPMPPPPPARITVVNQSGARMTLSVFSAENKAAEFKSEPAKTIKNRGSTTFEVESKDPHDPNTDGRVDYQLFLRSIDYSVNMFWKSEGKSFAQVVPFATEPPPADDLTVQVETRDADVTFTVVGKPGSDPEFNPPASGPKQPTLRKGDKHKDGWVEYLQEALNHHLGTSLVVDGDFGPVTHKEVIAFQTKHKDEGVMVDGVVGDQTWSFLREGVPEKPKTDGRKPHTYVEHGMEARWVREKGICRYDRGQDALIMQAVAVGDTDQMEGRTVRTRITDPDGTARVVDGVIGPAVPASTTGQGSTHDVRVEDFSVLFDSGSEAGPKPGDYKVEAYFDEELGGDKLLETVTVTPA